MRKIVFTFLLTSVIVSSSFSIPIKLKGFVPLDIKESAIAYEYKRIYKTLAPSRHIDNSELNITFYTKKGSSGFTYSLPEWGGGGAIGKDNIVVCMDLKPFLNHTIYQITVHELVHIVINRICKDTFIPRWFHEGLAMILSGDPTTTENIVISKALFTGSIMPLSSIDSVNSFGQFRAELAYCQSRQAIRYLIDTYGIEVVPDIIEAANRHESFWKGFFDVLQVSEQEFESFYRKFIIQHHGKFFWLVDYYLIWGGIVILFIVGYIVSVLRKRKILLLLGNQEEQKEKREIQDE